jgi:hypothetical protein
MSITHFLKAARILSFGTGISLSLVGQYRLGAELLTGPGSILTDVNATLPLHGAAFVPSMPASNAPMQFVAGIAFIIVGMLVHALIHERQEREVHITVVPKKPATKEMKWFWVEVKI